MSAFQMDLYLCTGAGDGQMSQKQNHGWKKRREHGLKMGLVSAARRLVPFQVWWSEALDLNHLLHEVALHPIILCISR